MSLAFFNCTCNTCIISVDETAAKCPLFSVLKVIVLKREMYTHQNSIAARTLSNLFIKETITFRDYFLCLHMRKVKMTVHMII